MTTHCTPEQLSFGRVGRREVVASFDGGDVTSDGGVLLLRAAAEKTRLVTSFVERVMRDYRDPGRVVHSLPELVTQRVLGMACGYEDLSDHDALRHDPLLALAAGKRDLKGQRRRARDRGKALASSATLGRLERIPENPELDRFARFDLDPELADDFFVDYFVASRRQQKGEEAPSWLVLDLDTSDIQLHGEQEGRHYHGHYHGYCYLPLYVYCGEHLLAVRLQTADADGARNVVEVLERIVPKLRSAWPGVRILIRGDSGFSRDPIYAYCEANDVDYVIGIARNKVLQNNVAAELAEAKRLSEASGAAARVYSEFRYRTKKTWSCERRVIAKAEYLGKANPRFVVTSLPAEHASPQDVYERGYCPRGEAENRIKEQQLYLFGNRASASTMRANQVRLYFSALAYLLIQAVRGLGLRGTELAQARADTIRLKLLKIGATVKVTTRKVWVRLSSHCPGADVFARARANLAAVPTLVM